ncbi:4,5-DOPA-extradiol-dioxygenase [Rhodococcus chondri]|uniref:4,5-DOPA dioxygenase extradiol n=1 Tax=Rhodococcus chondri TaxID=3065941 RepID=A0ABU7JU52_9NOCA|nr:4,5-DOPA dioxygenase extradiol [Rhodococcus sp. CC-R104]MEE2032802.1 4,5-DOPA dioxygenase extradiol [Rhodococcus sp. CC-R104]
MPVAFIGHGSPLNALDSNRYTHAWAAFGRSVPTPRAILSISAHWFINATAVTTMPSPRTIHDFFGFPQELFDVDYPAPGAPELTEEIADIVRPTWVGADVDSWGIDHGTWSVLTHMFPDANVPVVQLSLNAYKPLDYHVELGAKLAALRERGVLIVGSGNIVHNLGGMDPRRPGEGFDWAHRFDDAARDLLRDRPGDAARLSEHPEFTKAVPTPDHFLPMLYFAGLVAESSGQPDTLVDGVEYGSLSMTAYTAGMHHPDVDPSGGTSAALPEATDPINTNM